MSDMYTHAENIKEQIHRIGMSEAQLNIMLEFGRVAKFRCGSNVAFANFVNAILRDSQASLHATKKQSSNEKEYTVFQITGEIKPQEIIV